MDITALLLFGRARYGVLKCLFGLQEGPGLHLREIARRAGVSATAAQYELRLLLQAGLVVQQELGGRVLYRVDTRHAVASELRSIISKTDATREAEQIQDDAYWTGKRVQQRADYKARHLKRKSPFLANRGLARALAADLGKDVSYDY